MERRREVLSVSFSLSLSIKESESASFITIIVCLVGILLSVLEIGLCRKYSQNKSSKFKTSWEKMREGGRPRIFFLGHPEG